MKWLKHDSTALHDAKIQKLMMKYGIEGYGLYFACVEIIASNLTPQNITFELEHDSEILAHLFSVDTLKVEEMVKYCVTLGLFDINPKTNRIRCLQLAKRLDITMSQNPEIKKIVSNNGFNRLLAPDSCLKQIRLDKNRIEEKNKPYYPLAQHLLELHLEIDPSFVGKKAHNGFIEKSADAFRLLIENDGRGRADVEAILEWCKQDEFWATVIQSGKGFRRNYPTMYPQWQKAVQKTKGELIDEGYKLEEDEKI